MLHKRFRVSTSLAAYISFSSFFSSSSSLQLPRTNFYLQIINMSSSSSACETTAIQYDLYSILTESNMLRIKVNDHKEWFNVKTPVDHIMAKMYPGITSSISRYTSLLNNGNIYTLNDIYLLCKSERLGTVDGIPPALVTILEVMIAKSRITTLEEDEFVRHLKQTLKMVAA